MADNLSPFGHGYSILYCLDLPLLDGNELLDGLSSKKRLGMLDCLGQLFKAPGQVLR